MPNESFAVHAVLADHAPSDVLPLATQPGRWSSGRWPVIPASPHAAGALLEYLAQLESRPSEYLRLVQAWLPQGEPDAIRVDDDLLWRERPYRAEVQSLGDAWLERGSGLVATVPSVLCPHEYTLLINPRHPDFARIRYTDTRRFRLDQRLA